MADLDRILKALNLLSEMPSARMGDYGPVALLSLMTDYLLDNPKATASTVMTEVLQKAALLGGGLVMDESRGKKTPVRGAAGGSRGADPECWACGGRHLLPNCPLPPRERETIIRARMDAGIWQGPPNYLVGRAEAARGRSTYPPPPLGRNDRRR